MEPPSTEQQARFIGPVWAGLPQTAQSAEYAAWASAIQILDGPTTLYGDCLNVVRDAKAEAIKALRHGRMHAGAQNIARGEDAMQWVEDNVWVKAHRGITVDMDEATKAHVNANALADGNAKQAI